jgi:hypothetical protein|tara:strand:+ start:225 stop:437 length:213 start_codon:yes stop_codon:yes gene_type:complete
MFNEGDKVLVTCTDTEISIEGTVHKLNGDTVWVVINPNVPVIGMRKVHPGFYVGSSGGMEFTIGVRPTPL